MDGKKCNNYLGCSCCCCLIGKRKRSTVLRNGQDRNHNVSDETKFWLWESREQRRWGECLSMAPLSGETTPSSTESFTTDLRRTNKWNIENHRAKYTNLPHLRGEIWSPDPWGRHTDQPLRSFFTVLAISPSGFASAAEPQQTLLRVVTYNGRSVLGY